MEALKGKGRETEEMQRRVNKMGERERKREERIQTSLIYKSSLI